MILVEDDGNGIEGEKLAQIREELKYHRFKGKHIGVCNVNQRIKLKFGDVTEWKWRAGREKELW